MSHRSFVLLSRYHSGNVPLHIAEDLTPEELAKDYNKPPLELICIDGKTFRSYTQLKVCHLVHGYKTGNQCQFSVTRDVLQPSTTPSLPLIPPRTGKTQP